MSQQIGLVQKIFRHPFKSMAGESLKSAYIQFSGMRGDRICAFIDPEKTKNPFPWVSAREVPEMVTFKASLVKESSLLDGPMWPEDLEVAVQTPSGESFRAQNPAFHKLCEEQWSRSLIFRSSEKGMHDARPISILGAASVDYLSQKAGLDLEVERFRPNFFVEWNTKEPFFEDRLLNHTLQIGNKVKLWVGKLNSRCVITNVDPKTAAKNSVVLKTIGAEKKGLLGVYCAVLQEGAVSVGDEIRLIENQPKSSS